MSEELPLFLHWTRFLEWLLPKTGKFPRSVRFTLTSRIDNLALDVLEAIIEAQYRPGHEKLRALERASMALDKLRVFLRIAHRLGHLDHGGYELAAGRMDEAGRMTGGWIRHAGSS